MKNHQIETMPEENEMRPEYDFSGGVRGKHYRAYREGYTVTIHQEDGTTVTQQFEPDAGAIVLEPDVQEYFPDSEAVNRALRSIIALIPQKPKRTKPARKTTGYQHPVAPADSPHS